MTVMEVHITHRGKVAHHEESSEGRIKQEGDSLGRGHRNTQTTHTGSV